MLMYIARAFKILYLTQKLSLCIFKKTFKQLTHVGMRMCDLVSTVYQDYFIS